MAYTLVLSSATFPVWSQIAGDYTTGIHNGVMAAKLTSGWDWLDETDTIYEEFVVTTLPNLAKWSLRIEAYRATRDDGPNHPGAVAFHAELWSPAAVKVHSWDVTVSPAGLTNYLIEEDLTSHITTAGTYTIKLVATVRSAKKDGSPQFTFSYAWWYYDLISLDTDPPNAPTVTTGQPWSPSSSKISWNEVDRRATFSVHYTKTSPISWAQVTGIDAVNYILGSLDPVFDYYVYVAAVNVSGEGASGPLITTRATRTFTQVCSENLNLADFVPFQLQIVLGTTLNLAEVFQISRFKEIAESLGLTDDLWTHVAQNYSQYLPEALELTEIFGTRVFSPLETYGEKMLVFRTSDKGAYDYPIGNPIGYYDTDDIDFGLPGIVKGLDEIQLWGDPTAPLPIEVFISTNGGIDWLGPFRGDLQSGDVTYVTALCISGEKFRIRIQAAGLTLRGLRAFAQIQGGATPGSEVTQSLDATPPHIFSVEIP